MPMWSATDEEPLCRVMRTDQTCVNNYIRESGLTIIELEHSADNSAK